MHRSQQNLPPRFLRTQEAARFLGVSPRTLEKPRVYRTGSVCCRLGGCVVDAIADLQAWADRGLRSSTSDIGVGTIRPVSERYRQGG